MESGQNAALQAVELEVQGSGNLTLHKPFDPEEHDLDASFRLTKFGELKGKGCKVPLDQVSKLADGVSEENGAGDGYSHRICKFFSCLLSMSYLTVTDSPWN